MNRERLVRAISVDVAEGQGKHGEVAQAQKVHLEQTKLLQHAHLVARNGLAVLAPGQRHNFGQRLPGDDHPSRVDPGVPV